MNQFELTDSAIPFFIRKKGDEQFFYVFAFGNKRFQCRELKKAISQEDSDLLFHIAYREKQNGTYDGTRLGDFVIENKKYMLIKFPSQENWKTWLVPYN
jgi:hypothetical protein